MIDNFSYFWSIYIWSFILQFLNFQKLKSIINPLSADARKLLNQKYSVPLPIEKDRQDENEVGEKFYLINRKLLQFIKRIRFWQRSLTKVFGKDKPFLNKECWNDFWWNFRHFKKLSDNFMWKISITVYFACFFMIKSSTFTDHASFEAFEGVFEEVLVWSSIDKLSSNIAILLP